MAARLVAVCSIVAASVVIGYGQSSPVNRPWPPGVQQVPEAAPALSPEAALKTFYMPPGYHLELVASEPLVQDPTAIDWDPSGRLWVVEMTGFVLDMEKPEPYLEKIGHIVVLEDTNHDGRMDKRTVFADDLILPRAVKVLDTGVLVGEPGTLYWMRDTNGDLRADTREVLSHDYGRLEGSVEGNANSVFWAMDNSIYTTGAGVYLRLRDGQFEVRKTLSRGEWGITQDDAGRIYRNSSESALHVDLVSTPYFQRNPLLLRTRGSYDALDTDDALNTVWPVRPTPGNNRAYQVGIRRADGSLEKFTAACGPLVYRGDRLPAELYGNVFVAEPSANLVSRIVLNDDGTTIRAKKAYEGAEFIASTDERFRPVNLSNGPDGTMYVVDMYRGVIQNRASTTAYLRDRILANKLDQPTHMGRIYRVVHDTTTRDTSPGLQTATPLALVGTLSHPNGWRRDTAERLLVERSGRLRASYGPVNAALATLVERSPDWRTRVQALWTLDGIGSVQPALVTKALQDTSRDVRVAAIRVAERWLGDAQHPIVAEALKRIDDADWAVREQLAASFGALPAGAREAAIVRLLDRAALDPVAMDAALSSLRGVEMPALDAMLAGTGPETPQRAAALTMVAALIVRGSQDAPIQNLFAKIGDDVRPEWQRAAVLRGTEVAVLGSPLPGAPARRGGGPGPSATPLPCPTCPGGRAGPGGEYAFPGVIEAQRANAPAATGRGNAPLRLNREPVALSTLSTGSDPLATRAAALIARVEWPGKPGARAPIAPLTMTEQQRFDAGREIYKNICENCHQPDGRGQDKVAANLIGSTLALAPADIPARILLSGKEGPIGLMPPLGATLSDTDVAAVLTYVRREWGQDGSPVDPAIVQKTRAATTDRTRPWTNDELLRMASAPAQ